MRVPRNTVHHFPGLSLRQSLHPFDWPIHEELREVSYPHRFLPPSGHPLQCQGILTNELRQCDQWSLQSNPRSPKNSRYCRVCELNHPVTSIYKQKAGPQLKKLLEEAEAGAPADRLSIVAEIDLARVAASEAVTLFNAVLENPDKANPGTKAQTVALLQSALQQVAVLVKAQSSILSNTDGIMTVEQFTWILETMKKVVFETLGEDSVKAEDICERFDKIQPPSKGVAEHAIRVSFN